ncbi:hypothetical protein [Ferrimonas gelatinilytica]|uniref:CPBP family intramembrane metalloprotease n=1 Tax=Ferrimonas gelatinilytica TaxID=1255257 RepID=A0ABP9SDH6_9GAMM
MAITPLLMIKVLLAASMVLGLARIAERVGPEWAGLLSGAPLGVALVLFFYGIEQGVEYAAAAAFFALFGLMAALVFAYLFVILVPHNKGSAPWPLIGALAGYGAAAALLLQLLQLLGVSLVGGTHGKVPGLPLVLPIAMVAAALALGVGLILRRQPVSRFGSARLSRRQQGIRAVVAALLVVMITALAHCLTPAAAGVLAGFPLVLFALMLVLQWHHGSGPVAAVVSHFPFGMGSLILYTLTVTLTYPTWGLIAGTAVSMLVALLYLVLLGLWRHKRTHR